MYRSVINYSKFSDVYCKKLCSQYGFFPMYDFAFRCNMELNPLRTVVVIFLSTCLVLSYIIRIFEKPYYRQLDINDTNYRQLDSYFDANYWMVITMTTVGYGDLSPNTWMGRIVIMAAALIGCLITAIFIGSITNQFTLSSGQHLALHHILVTKSAAHTVH
jgi:hypothetical protein